MVSTLLRRRAEVRPTIAWYINPARPAAQTYCAALKAICEIVLQEDFGDQRADRRQGDTEDSAVGDRRGDEDRTRDGEGDRELGLRQRNLHEVHHDDEREHRRQHPEIGRVIGRNHGPCA